jgi:plastocyanin
MKTLPILALASVLLIAGCGGSSSATRRKTLVQMTASDTFTPQTVTVRAGSTVRWTNADSDAHTVAPDVATVGMSSDEMFPTGLPSGASFEWKVPEGAASGTRYFYHCRFHGTAGDGTGFGTGMTGVVVVE